ncbi:phospholipid methyltransferase [Paucimonas lemoignei]|uniref:Phospholipid methyltransferase n=2 Tax=Paucimonas lemoignei TaxID=29443 RepID=A0A4R3HVE8_PAULE|nr:phospholipid methyltransferase [Paucimonas lemoignei]
MYAISQMLPAWRWDWPGSTAIGVAVVLIGIVLDFTGVLAFYRARTTINPLKPSGTSSIVQGGAYRFTRNPMYLGLLLVLTGYGLYLSHPLAFVVLPVFVAYLTRFQIIPEERILREKFGQAYVDYASRVRRWI